MKGKYQVTLIDLKACKDVTVKADCEEEANRKAKKKAKRISDGEHEYKPYIVLPLGVCHSR